MESKTLLLDLVQQRKDGRITQEEMVRQLVELRNQVRAHTVTPCSSAHPQTTCDAVFPQDTGASSLATANASAVAAPADQRASIHADIERQRQEKLAAKQKDGAGSDPRQAWGPPSPSASPSLAPPLAASMPPGAREASTIARSYCSAVGAQHRDARSVFDAYDTSRSGVITFEDLRRGVRNDPSMSKSGLTDTDVRPPTYPSFVGKTRALAGVCSARRLARRMQSNAFELWCTQSVCVICSYAKSSA